MKINHSNCGKTTDFSYVVFEYERIYGLEKGYAEGSCWVGDKGKEIDKDGFAEAVDYLADYTSCYNKININGLVYRRVYYRTNKYKFVNAFINEQTALDFIEANITKHPTAYLHRWEG